MDGACRPGSAHLDGPSQSVLYRCVQEHLAIWLAQWRDGHDDDRPVPVMRRGSSAATSSAASLRTASPARGVGSAATAS